MPSKIPIRFAPETKFELTTAAYIYERQFGGLRGRFISVRRISPTAVKTKSPQSGISIHEQK